MLQKSLLQGSLKLNHRPPLALKISALIRTKFREFASDFFFRMGMVHVAKWAPDHSSYDHAIARPISGMGAQSSKGKSDDPLWTGT